MARRGRGISRAGARAAAAARRTATPQVELSDNEMQDAPSDAATPQEDQADNPESEEVEEAEVDDATPLPEAEDETPSRLRSRIAVPVPQKRRAGRPPKNTKPIDWDAVSDGDSKGVSDAGTPKKRGGFRGHRGFGGGRWRSRGGPSHVSQVPLDKEGNMANVVDDEVELPDDAEGETKVDKNGHLKDGREYRVRTFTVSSKGDKLYMLSTEPARCIGFRDSYLFFQKHRHLFKIILTDEAKRDLIERNLIPHSYKGRAIGVVTARSVYREFGARIIIGGKKITDDYLVAAARANGDVEGEVAVPEDQLPAPGVEYDRNRYVAWHGASSVYHSGIPTVPTKMANTTDRKKTKVQITNDNWKLEHSRAASRFNSELAAQRRANADGIYDIYTNQMLYPQNTQPTQFRWEEVVHVGPSGTQPANANTNTGDISAANANAAPDDKGKGKASASAPSDPLFPPVSDHQYRNYETHDVVYRNPPASGFPAPGTGGYGVGHGPIGLNEVSQELVDLLPPECVGPFLEAREKERQWRDGWSTDQKSAARKQMHITYNDKPVSG